MYVYFLQSEIGGPIKIGTAINAKKRLKEIQAVNPYKIEIVALIRGSYKEEKKFHKSFKEHRLHGEWFEPVESLNKLVKNLGICNMGAAIQEKPLKDSVVKMLTMRQEGKTFQQIADEFQVSRQRIHQLIENST
jgi:mRNA-degrading endonuclease YafQ of YafQ-DinJ toxin-antitoxin module